MITRFRSALTRFRTSSGRTSESGFVSPIARSPSFRTDVEGLRGIAVLLVVLYHARVPGFDGGFIGVDVFFVLSGYLITGLLVKEIARSGRLDLLQFYARRARRLLPAAALVLVATIVAGMVVFGPLEQAQLARTAFASAAYMSNLWFAYRSANYFATGTENDPLLHTWSLSVEEQFYVVWPVLILLALRGGGSRGRLLALMAGVSLLSLAGSLWLTETRQAWAFYGSPARAWEFGLGGIASLLSAGVLRSRPKASRALGWIGLLFICGATLGFSKETNFPGVAALIPVAGTIAVLLAGVGAPDRGVGRILGVAPLQRMGQLSYSWYLWHWPVLVIAAAVFPALSLPGRLLCVLFALGLAAVTYVLVENPIRHHKRLALRPAYSLGLAVLLTMSTGAASLGWRHAALQTSASPVHQMYLAAMEDRHQLGRCNASWGIEHSEGCVFGDPASSVTVVLFGDSHAAQWFSAFRRIAEEEGWRLVTLTKSACPAAALPFVDRRYRRADECANWREDAMEQILDLDPDVVVLGNADRFYRKTGDEWEAGFEATLGALDEAEIPALVLWGVPRAPMDLPECLSRAVVQGQDPEARCAIERSAAFDSTAYLAALEVASAMEEVVVADVSDQFCDDSVCDPIVDGAVLLYDTNHLTASRAESVAPALAEYIHEILAAEDG